jgi:hypothetical protein
MTGKFGQLTESKHLEYFFSVALYSDLYLKASICAVLDLANFGALAGPCD